MNVGRLLPFLNQTINKRRTPFNFLQSVNSLRKKFVQVFFGEQSWFQPHFQKGILQGGKRRKKVSGTFDFCDWLPVCILVFGFFRWEPDWRFRVRIYLPKPSIYIIWTINHRKKCLLQTNRKRNCKWSPFNIFLTPFFFPFSKKAYGNSRLFKYGWFQIDRGNLLERNRNRRIRQQEIGSIREEMDVCNSSSKKGAKIFLNLETDIRALSFGLDLFDQVMDLEIKVGQLQEELGAKANKNGKGSTELIPRPPEVYTLAGSNFSLRSNFNLLYQATEIILPAWSSTLFLVFWCLLRWMPPWKFGITNRVR